MMKNSEILKVPLYKSRTSMDYRELLTGGLCVCESAAHRLFNVQTEKCWLIISKEPYNKYSIRVWGMCDLGYAHRLSICVGSKARKVLYNADTLHMLGGRIAIYPYLYHLLVDYSERHHKKMLYVTVIRRVKDVQA